MWSLEVAQRLVGNSDFKALFEGEQSPLAQELERLERVALDPATPLDKKQEAVCRRAGILKVWDSVQGSIDAAAQEQEAAARPARPRGRYLTRMP